MKTTVSALNFRAAILLLLATAAAAVWFWLCFSFPDFAPAGIPNLLLLMLVSNGILLFGLWRGLARTEFTATAKTAVWFAITVPFLLWMAVIWGLAEQGTFLPQRSPSRYLPLLPIAILVPLVTGLVLLTRSKRVAALLDATPPSWLIGLQVYRILGGVFLAYWAHGAIPGAFALPAGIGDVAVGLLALPAALWVSTGSPVGMKLGTWWNVLGLADFAVAVATGMMTSPGPLHLLALDQPNTQIATFPTAMIPAFAVPSSIMLHVLSLWQLRRLKKMPAPHDANRR
jgi:hypothetical protein